MSKIRVLPDFVARKIAAGEVIERPASVVKELVENSLDAGAGRVVVELDQGGRSRVAVTDDGEGMAREDVLVAFEPHATSKIRGEEDLLRISTLGFRGEALPSIAAVSNVELWTCRRGEAVGTHLKMRGGKPLPAEDVGTAVGCRIEVRELFAATPARRKFLKAPATEAGHVAQLVGRFALARPDVGFELRHETRTTLSLAPGTRRERIRRVLGAEIEAEMRTVESEGPLRLSGFVTHPRVSFANSRSILFFVNGRLVRDRLLQHAIVAAYATLVPQGRHPAAVLFLDLPPEEVDVNVHPAKLEVRFRDSQAIHDAIRLAVRDALRSAPAGVPLVAAEASPAYPPRGASPPPPSGARRLHMVSAATENEPLPFERSGLFSALRVVGQVFDGYLVCEGDGEVVLIDQHAAHERVAFERLRLARLSGRVESQSLLVAQPIEVGTGEVELLAAAAEDLAACGLDLEPFGDRTVLVRSVPALLPAGAVAPLVRAIASDLGELERSRALEARTESVLATIACHSVVRVGQRLSEGEMRGLLSAMDSIDLNSNCPHGRPVATRMPRAEVERRFGR
ncbi:MAG TPA: DNA mismatch repair endonuclease MutL [Candidatus Binatia bacterium]|nr:DNA mismatch repair endonuclease MutL [Candidatus Binatia bacterium]